VRVAVLGSTGSIGRQALDVLAGLRPDFEVVALAAGRDASRLAEQVAAWRPRAVALADPGAAADLSLPRGTRLQEGDDALLALATRPDVDVVLVATGGVVSLRPVLVALASGKVVATANKETLVAGGHLVMPLARSRAAAVAEQQGASDPHASPLAWLRPIDSEHSAIWQCLAGEARSDVARLILTASGGPFRLEPGDLVYIPAGTASRIRPDDVSIHMRYKALHAGLEAVAWFCSSCGNEVHRDEFDTEEELPQDAYWRACNAFNADVELRRCRSCGAVHDMADLSGIRWPEVAAAIKSA